MTEQAETASDASVESRLASFFAPEAAPKEQPQAETTEQTETTEPVEAVEAEPTEAPFEIDGEEYVLPVKLKAKVEAMREGQMRRDDYTRKTQEYAELTKQVATIAETASVAQHFDKEIAPEREELARVKHQIGQYKTLDWAALDPSQQMVFRNQVDQLKDKASELESTIKTKQAGFDAWKDQKKAEVIASGKKYLQQTIKGWGAESVKEVSTAAREVGYTDKEIESVLDPRFVRLAYKAAQFDKLQAQKPAAVAAAQKAPPIVKPGVSKGPTVAAEQKYKDLRSSLKKSGSLQDAARLFMLKG